MGFDWGTLADIGLAPVTGGASLIPGFNDAAENFISGGGTGASKDQVNAANNAMDLQRQIYNQSREDRMPWMTGGQQSLAQLLELMQSGGFNNTVNPQTLANDPGYQFRMAEGQKALERSAAARGGLNSGGFMKGLAQYSQGLGAQEYQQAWGRNQAENQAKFGRLADLAGMGENAAAGLGQLGQGYGNSMSSLYGALGNAQGAGDQSLWGGLNSLARSAITMGAGGMGGAPSFGGGYGGPSASSLYASNPGSYSLGNYNLIPTQG